jgi:diguanylate cyclase (GGDEF)-like protein
MDLDGRMSEGEEMSHKKSMKRSIITGCVLFITALCLLLGFTTYREYRKALYGRYEAYITDVLNYVGANIDVDDLKDCLDQRKESEKFVRLQAFMDLVKDTHKIDFLYIVIPQHPGEHDNIMNVMAAMAAYEKADPELYPPVVLGGLTGDSYPAETAAKYYNAMDKDSIVFFEEAAEWGIEYTGILSLRTSDGSFFAELCVDVPVQEIHETIRRHMIVNLSMIIGIGILFTVLFIFWTTKNIVSPIRKLEKSVAGFASQKHGEKLVMEAPDIHIDNEVGSLAAAVMKMADDINDYISETIEAERVASEMKELATRDSLTGIRNKAAFTSYVQELQDGIDRSEQTDFAVGVFDCDNLKGINDRYGHEKGDEYLKAASRLICSVFKYSPVFRIGGDEFAAILRNEDFLNRIALADEFYRESDKINAAAHNEWERVHTSMGIVTFDPLIDRAVSDTLRRADKVMYENKRGGKRRT